MKTEFRKSRPEDVQAILSIIAQAQAFLKARGVDQWQDGYPDEAVVRRDMQAGVGYVLTCQERTEAPRVCGMATIVWDGEPSYAKIYDGAWTTGAPYACIHRIALDSTRRGTGLSGVLMREAEKEILGRGFHSVRIDTHQDNQVMRRMLEKNGYRHCGTIYLSRTLPEQGAARVAYEKGLMTS